MSGYSTGGTVTAPLESFVVQHFDGKDWQDVPGTDTQQNEDVDWHRRFEPITTARMRLLVRKTQIDVSRIWEVELYEPPAK